MTAISQSIEDNLENLAEKVDTAINDVRKLDAAAQKQAMALKSAVEEFHKVGITHIVKKLKDDPRGKELLFELVDDPTVYALFAMHGIVRIEGDTAFVRLHGACNGCSMSAVTLRESVEEALFGQINELKRVEVVPNDPGPALISLDSLQVVTEDSGWIEGPASEEVPAGSVFRLDVEQDSYVIVNLENKLSAFENSCAHMGLPIDGGLLDVENGTLTCPWHGWCYNASNGECLTAPQAQLEPLPLRINDGKIWIRPK